MALRKGKYYDITNLLSTNAHYMMLLGERANGKSYQVKKTVLQEAYSKHRWFVYLRRYQADIRAKAVSAYFEDMPVSDLTSGEYTGVTAYNGEIYFTYRDPDGELKKGLKIGRYCDLNDLERYKSWAFPDYDYIMYEEFITDSIYLNDEPTMLQQFVSTVARHRKITVFLIGNTLSRVCPYFSEWCLDGVLKQKIGTIELYHFHVVDAAGDDSTIDIAVEYCANANFENKMFFGHTAKQIVSGEWETHDMPKLPRKQHEYENVYEVLVEYQSFKFVLSLLCEPIDGGLIVFIYPFTGQRKIERIIRQDISDNPLITGLLDPQRIPEARIIQCAKMRKIAYSDNLTGADFTHVNQAIHLLPIV